MAGAVSVACFFRPPVGTRNTSVAARVTALCLLAVTLVILAVAPAGGHAIVKTTHPQADEIVTRAPSRVVMRFNEPVEIAFGAIRVFDAAGRRVDEGNAGHTPGEPDEVAVDLSAELEQGTYTVSWRIISADSHPIAEAFVFHVGAPGANPEGLLDQVLVGGAPAGRTESFLLGVTRWVNFMALLTLVGALLFLPLVWRPKRTFSRSADVEGRFHRRWAQLLRWSWVALVVVTLLSLWVQGAVAGATTLVGALSPTVVSEVLRTRFGAVVVIKLVLLAAGAALWVASRSRIIPRYGVAQPVSVGAGALAPTPPRALLASAVVFAAALALTPGLAGHAGTTPPIALNLASDATHVVAAALWLGGLVTLLWAAFPATGALPTADRVWNLAPAVRRYSDLALVAVAVLVLTGTYRGWVEVRSLPALVSEPYGVALLLKLAVFLPLLALGAVNNRWTMPRIHAAAAAESPDIRPLAMLRRLVGIEVGIGVLVLAVTAVLVNLPPARVMATDEGQAVYPVTVGEHELAVSIAPNRVGENTIRIGLAGDDGVSGSTGVHATDDAGMSQNTAGEDSALITAVTVNFTMAAQHIGPLVAEAEHSGTGDWIVRGRELSVPGEWTLEIVTRIGRFEEERAAVDIVVPR